MTELNTNTNQRKDEEVTSTINEEENEGNEVNEVNDLNEYIKLFKETKNMHKLNMELFII